MMRNEPPATGGPWYRYIRDSDVFKQRLIPKYKRYACVGSGGSVDSSARIFLVCIEFKNQNGHPPSFENITPMVDS